MRAKQLAIIILLIPIFVGLNFTPAAGLELDVSVDEAIYEFIAGYQMSEFEIDQLADPFADFRPPEPEEPGEIEEPDPIEPPQFQVNGVVRRGDQLLIIVDDGNILRPGESLEGYVFSHTIDHQVIFTKEGEQFELSAREGETR